MAWFLHTEHRDYVLLDSNETTDIPAVRRFATSEEAVAFLLEFKFEDFGMATLREIVAERQYGSDVSGQSNDAVVQFVAWELASGRLRLADEARYEHAHGRPGEPGEPEEPEEPENPEPIDQPTNTVTPHIAVEYKVVLLDKDLAKHQEGSETKILTGVTRVEVWYSQTNGSIPFEKGATFACAPANAEVYRDETCATKLEGDLTPEDIAGGKRVRLYLKGKTAGKFTAKYTLKDPVNGQILLADNPAEEEMGVVTLEFKLHQQDLTAVAALQVDPDTDPIDTYYTNLKNKAMPAQKVMTDEEKVKTGRLLHAQKDGSFSRAKLILKKLNAAEWPSGTDDYEVCLNEDNTSGSAAIHGKEWDNDLKAFPVKVKVSVLKAADKEFWVEGKSAVKKLREVKIDAGIDRAVGGLTKTAKRNGDWARLTVVQIKEVKVDYTPVAGTAVAWDSAHNKFYINLQADPDGRKITIRATLSEKLKDIVIHFMLAEDKNNRKAANWGKNLPGTWKWKDISATVKHKDKADRKNIIHLSAKTNNDGYATKELQLSRFGGDKFYPGAYIEQDPHLGKFIDGHADLGKKKPVLAANALTVYRKIWFQPVKVTGMSIGNLAGAVPKYDAVKTEMTACADLQIAKATAQGMNPQAIYARFMIQKNGGNADALVVSETNKAQFFNAFAAEADKPMKIPILVCDAQWDPDGNTGAQSIARMPVANLPGDLTTDKKILIPPLQGGDLKVSGTYTAWRKVLLVWVRLGGANRSLPNSCLSVNPARGSLFDVRISKPDNFPKGATHIKIDNLVLKGADDFLGEYDPTLKRILVVHDPAEPVDSLNTIVHELGHSLHQVIEGNPAGGVAGIPRHPKQKDKGQGNHCRNLVNKCVMYDSGPIQGSLNRYCDMCHPYLLVQDMTQFADP